ncbi:MAG: anhydro-N-acetylmuramic acid kinase [Gammaproteobacteria bacterium]|nr:anhydro-N-acetylmuramic acid kinase [Gammaproteobacteria bacterium]
MTRDSKPLYLGTMSGTSMDGLDLVAIDFSHNKPVLQHHGHTPYPDELRKNLQHAALNESTTISAACNLDTQLGQFYAQEINLFLDKNSIQRDEIAAIGSHGQTIRHSPQGGFPYTLQIGDPNIIAARTGLNVVADFRRRDLALGGQGAPLTPAFHHEVFLTELNNRAIINIGGIANITLLAADSSIPVTGFDTGPGNTLMDHLSALHLGQNFDRNGNFARSGKVHSAILQNMLTESFFHLKAPKSTGTDHFSPAWLEKHDLNSLSPADAMCTTLELTAASISQSIKMQDTIPDECFVCGGGAHNGFLLERLQHHLRSVKVDTTEKLGISPDWVEATAFAWLARQTMLFLPGNLPSVTNAKYSTILGGVYFSHGQY